MQLISINDIDYYRECRNCILVDLRTMEEYDQKHFPGAISLPYDYFDVYKNMLSKKYVYIFYCHYGSKSLLVARDLERIGYKCMCVCGNVMKLLK